MWLKNMITCIQKNMYCKGTVMLPTKGYSNKNKPGRGGMQFFSVGEGWRGSKINDLFSMVMGFDFFSMRGSISHRHPPLQDNPCWKSSKICLLIPWQRLRTLPLICRDPP